MTDQGFVEHVNITVRDCRASASVLEALFGWHVRWEGPAMNDGHTVHVGTDKSYIALYTPPPALLAAIPFAKGLPMNHVGIVVDDLDAVEARVLAAGLTPFNHADYAPGRRFYFFDENGIEYEVISYG
ncbi:VOC family protein [Blastomonas sp. UPD001]|jgi:catechol 2,3-dioxygenase-like lactoylglutathione lyase family enzyme|uniref:VOC family protein n=1 Tax=Blastomonas sp. UPD001 TaxID=2217673 RepID=UPI000E346A3D|nr:VOC family protein [Blastomonas sp. UPD001]MBL0966310.1 VOC family protein [Blastomonas sp.]